MHPRRMIQVIHGDRRDRDDFENKMRAEKFDAVIDMISYNADDAASALRAFRGRVDGFIHCSTVMTYGPPFPFSGVNIPETAPLNGTSEYGRGKIAADQLLLDAHAEDGFPCNNLQAFLHPRTWNAGESTGRRRRELDRPPA